MFIANAKIKAKISCAVTTQLISVFVFPIKIVQPFFLNPKFQVSSHLLWPYRQIVLDRSKTSHDTAHILSGYVYKKKAIIIMSMFAICFFNVLQF